MGYFPFFVDLSGVPGLIVGGGTAALRKIEKLLPFGPELTVVSPEICPAIRAIPDLTVIQRRFRPTDLDNVAFAVACTNCPSTDRRVAGLCRPLNIPINVVNDPQYCTFFFSALVRRGSLSVGVSTAGTSPAAAVWLKEQIDGVIPERFDEILDYIGSLRPALRARFPEHLRPALFRELFHRCATLGRPMIREELDGFLRGFEQQEETA